MHKHNLLVELLVEELPPKALKKLGEAFAGVLAEQLQAQGLAEADARLTSFASPRRLAAHICGVAARAPDRPVAHKLMPVSVGLDASGAPTQALLKRLAALGADATTIYPITKGKPLGRLILRSELRDPNPYNTRAIAGLPVGPITNPGREAIAAVLDPAPTKALYYVADGTGGHVFNETLEEHNADAARWRALRRARGEM